MTQEERGPFHTGWSHHSELSSLPTLATCSASWTLRALAQQMPGAQGCASDMLGPQC
jgi:hypothetical protein